MCTKQGNPQNLIYRELDMGKDIALIRDLGDITAV